ncbi:MAG: DUF4365 domain-containing protein [Patescibacteria group bacterium]
MLSASYTKRKQIGNKGAALVEKLLSEDAIVHRIDEAKDVGVDLLCEWVCKEAPTGILFVVQVKTRKGVIPKSNNSISAKNHLPEYKCAWKGIEEKNLNYLRGFNLPVYLFIVNPNNERVFYKRYTAILHELDPDKTPFYLATKAHKFQAYVTPKDKSQTGGFCRDLFFDHLRCQHKSGLLSGRDPADFGLKGWDSDVIYRGVYDDYTKEIKTTYDKYNKYFKDRTKMEKLSYEAADPTF